MSPLHIGSNGKRKSKRSQDNEEDTQLLKGASASAAAPADQNPPKLIQTDPKSAADQMMQVSLGQKRYGEIAQQQAKDAAIVEEGADDDDEYESDSDPDIDEDTKEVIKIVNVHKTYLLGIEGVPALRGVNLTI